MRNVWEQPWFWPVLAVVVGLPVVLLILTELQSSLVRRGKPSAKLVNLLKNFVLPSAAILILVSQVTISVDSEDFTWTRIIATVFGFLVILFVLNTVNLTLFTNARRGTWRDRLPSIFVDIARLVLICVGLAILFSLVWGTDVAGLFTALGVGSIVIGLALQGAIGSVVSGLLLLFEQPFRLGDWLDTGGVRGRVVQVNWRAVHIDTGNGIQITPNASLAGASFTNISQSPTYTAATTVSFTTDDPPLAVCRLLQRVANSLPQLSPGTTATAVPLGGTAYEVSFELATPAAEGHALATFRGWLWYAARREGLSLDGDSTDAFATAENIDSALQQITPTLRLTDSDIDALRTVVRLERYASGEVVMPDGIVPDAMKFVVHGVVSLGIDVDGDVSPVSRVEAGDYIGQSALTREQTITKAIAATETALLVLPVAALDGLLRRKPVVAREIGKVIDQRQAEATAANRATGNLQVPARA